MSHAGVYTVKSDHILQDKHTSIYSGLPIFSEKISMENVDQNQYFQTDFHKGGSV